MTLPVVGSLFKLGGATPLGNANRTFPAVTSNNNIFEAKKGNGEWYGNTFTTSGEGYVNYWYVPQAGDGNVSYCVVPRRGRGNAYVRSDNFGGCEWHILENEQYDFLAFLHVHRGNGGNVAQYTTGPGWKLIDWRQSSNVTKAGMFLGSKMKTPGVNSSSADGLTWVFSTIDRTGAKPVIETAVLNLMAETAGARVRIAMPGDAPYTPPR